MPENPNHTQRIYLLLQKRQNLLTLYTLQAEKEAREKVANALRIMMPANGARKPGFEVVSLPSRPSVMMETAAGPHPVVAGIRELVVTLLVNPRDLPFFRNLPRIAPPDTVTAFGYDAPIRLRGHWSTVMGLGNRFSSREKAEKLIRRQSLQMNGTTLTGQGVHVALIDSGLDVIERQRLGMTYGMSYAGSEHLKYASEAPPAPRYDHAFTMARNFKMIAPNVTLHDYAVLPSRLSKALVPSIGIEVDAFLSDMVAVYITLHTQISLRQSLGDYAPWVISNSWSVYERTWDPSDPNAVPNPDMASDPLNAKIALVATLGADIIFCAGNGGQFGNDPRCGENDVGPGRSIIGPNGHPDVITVGSVRSDGGWIGSSSQGPGIMGTQLSAIQKPDIVIPSDFAENEDGSQLNTGTSTSCAITAAVVAAIREGWPLIQRNVLKTAIINCCWQMDTPGWNNRTGNGILNVEDLTTSLPQ
jgi:subtilisin family serine protease